MRSAAAIPWLMLGAIALAACDRPSTQTRPTVPLDQRMQAIEQAIADPGRAAHRPADARRKPAELLLFSGVQRGDRVLDLIPGDGYFTRIFSMVVGPEGRVYAVWPEAYAKLATGNVATLLDLSRSREHSNIMVLVQPTAQLTAPEPLDLVWTSQNYHDYADEFMGKIGPAVLNQAAFDMLRPGGTYIVIDHAAPAGTGIGATETLHRIDPEAVKQQVQSAGFEFVEESGALRNPEDSLAASVFDPAIRGRTSQFAFKFRKPS